MNPSLASSAAGTLRQISESEHGERSRRAAAGALVLAAVESAAARTQDEFVLRRARREVEAWHGCSPTEVCRSRAFSRGFRRMFADNLNAKRKD